MLRPEIRVERFLHGFGGFAIVDGEWERRGGLP